MKKRVLSLFLVICFVFTGVLGVCVSADVGLTIVGELIEKTIEYAFDSGDYGFLFNAYPSAVADRFEDLSDEDRQNIMNAYHDKLREADEYEPINDDSSWKSDLKPIEFYLKMSAEAWGAPAPVAGSYHYMIWAINTGDGYYQINVRIIYDTSHYDDWIYFHSNYNEPCVERPDRANFSCFYCQIVDNTPLGGTTCRAINGTYYAQKNGCYTNQNMDASNVYCYATDMGESPLRFASDFSAPSHKQYNITLTANKPVSDDLIAVFGVLYNDGTHVYDGTDCGYISADYIGSASLQGGQEWEWHFNQQEFSNWAYRKRIFDTDCFYAFVHVLDGDKIVYADSRKLNLYDPTGIFEDVQQLPDYDDYKPTPSPLPTFPTPTFNYSPNNNYTTYNYDTVNNYDSTTQNFNDWLGDTVTTINNNLSGGLDNLSHNISVTGDNIKNFTEEVKNYVEGSGADISEYIGDLIKKFNNDFNAWTDSFGVYIGDLFQGLQDNMNVIADNIINAIKIQTIPDQDVVLDIMISNCDWFKQGYDLLKSRSEPRDGEEAEVKNMVFELPLVGESTFTVDFNSYLDSDYCHPLRSASLILIYASTFIGALNIIFKIFGLGFGSTDD